MTDSSENIADDEEEIVVTFVMDKKNGKIKKVKNGKPGGKTSEEAPGANPTCGSAVVATKNSPGNIYIWIGRWVCIPS